MAPKKKTKRNTSSKKKTVKKTKSRSAGPTKKSSKKSTSSKKKTSKKKTASIKKKGTKRTKKTLKKAVTRSAKPAHPSKSTTVNPTIFREYDIRGIVGSDLTPEVAELIGKAYGTYMTSYGAATVTVGRDVRLSSLSLTKGLIKGIRSSGINVIDVGEVPTPVLYYSIVYYKTDGGIMITGSHNPREYNGFKMCLGLSPIYGDQIQELRKLIEDQAYASGSGSFEEREIVDPYVEMIKQKIRFEKPFKIVIDAGNGTAGVIAPRIFRELGCEVIELYCELDGNFPNHLPDPTKLEYVVDLQRLVKEHHADLGLGFDGDSDRVGAIDEKGRVIYADKLIALFAREINEKSPGSKILFDVKCSQALVEDIEAHGGVPVMYKTGHSLLKAKMKELHNPLAGEMSGHIFFADDFFGYDDAIYVACRLVQQLSRTRETLSSLSDSIPQFVSTPEIRVDTTEEDKFRIVDEVREYFRAKYPINDVDGVRILYGDGWGLVRASNTQPVLVVRFEAKETSRLEEIMNEVIGKLREYPSVQINEKDLVY